MDKEVLWLNHAPTPDDVISHGMRHPSGFVDPLDGISIAVDRKVGVREASPATNWLCLHENSHWGTTVGVILLRSIHGRVYLANGYSFWQPLDECRWIHNRKYLPLTKEGLPA